MIVWRSLMRPAIAKPFGGILRRNYALSTDKCASPPSKGLILGIYADEEDMFDTGTLTPAGARYNEVSVVCGVSWLEFVLNWTFFFPGSDQRPFAGAHPFGWSDSEAW